MSVTKCCWIVALVAGSVSAQVRITYLANERILLSYSDAKVLIDALFRDSLGDYPRHSVSTQEQLETGKPPFDRVHLAVATHYHLDHWDAGAISRFLRHNPAAIFASAPQATGMIPREIRHQVRVLWPVDGNAAEFQMGAIRVEEIPLEHGDTQNLGIRLTAANRVVIHLGDAEPSRTNFDRLSAAKPPDVAIVPFWWLLNEDALSFVRDRWKPRHVIAVHFGSADAARSAPRLNHSVPGVWLCTRQGESRVY